jgi:hypothetical protein
VRKVILFSRIRIGDRLSLTLQSLKVECLSQSPASAMQFANSRLASASEPTVRRNKEKSGVQNGSRQCRLPWPAVIHPRVRV